MKSPLPAGIKTPDPLQLKLLGGPRVLIFLFNYLITGKTFSNLGQIYRKISVEASPAKKY